jgi:hypothetical protein
MAIRAEQQLAVFGEARRITRQHLELAKQGGVKRSQAALRSPITASSAQWTQ